MLYMYDTVCHTWYTTLLNNTMVLCCTRQILLSLTGFCRTFLFLLHTVYHSNIISQSHYVIVPMDALCAVDDKYTLITEIKCALDDGVYDIIYLVCIIYIYICQGSVYNRINVLNAVCALHPRIPGGPVWNS